MHHPILDAFGPFDDAPYQSAASKAAVHRARPFLNLAHSLKPTDQETVAIGPASVISHGSLRRT